MLNNSDINITQVIAKDIMTKNPQQIVEDELAINAWQLMQEKNINQLLVTSAKGYYVGLLHIQQLIKEGIIL
jgi:arabinose-5-phosphate isomerase